MSDSGFGRVAVHYYPVLEVAIGCILFFLKWEEMVVRERYKKLLAALTLLK